MLVHRIMKHGKKSLAYMKGSEKSYLRQAIRRRTPDIVFKSRRVGGSIHQVPISKKVKGPRFSMKS